MQKTTFRWQSLQRSKYTYIIVFIGICGILSGSLLSAESQTKSAIPTSADIATEHSANENATKNASDNITQTDTATRAPVPEDIPDSEKIWLTAADQLQKQIAKNPTKSRLGLDLVPSSIPAAATDGKIYFKTSDARIRLTTLDSKLQASLSKFVKKKGNHISALIIADAKNGNILAMVQGKKAQDWGQEGHSALYPGFPAASVFKNVTATAALDVLRFDEDRQIGLRGGCANVHSRGVWLKDVVPTRNFRMTLRLAYGRSCNGFFAKMAVEEVGLGTIRKYARRFRWGETIPSDFFIAQSPMIAPKAAESNIHTVGRFAAGFGLVGLSAAHAAWFSIATANNGLPIPLRIFADTPLQPQNESTRIFSKDTGIRLRSIMKKTTHGGTAGSIYRKRRYRRLRPFVGGKTGTLNGKTPRGLTTWFVGMMPIESPEIVVAAVTVTSNFWIIKGPHLAAEGFRQWSDLKKKRQRLTKISKNQINKKPFKPEAPSKSMKTH